MAMGDVYIYRVRISYGRKIHHDSQVPNQLKEQADRICGSDGHKDGHYSLEDR